MEFKFTEQQAMIAATAKDFFASHATSERVRAAMAGDGVDHELWRSFTRELGFGGVALPEAHGGAGLGMVEQAIVAEAAGAHIAPLPLLSSLAMAAQALNAGGTEAQKACWLPALGSGEVVGAAAGSADAIVQDGALSGEWRFVAHGGAAQMFVLGGEAGAWIVEAQAHGVSVRRHASLDQTRPYATLVLDRASAEPLADPAAALAAARTGGWICLAAEALGGAQACLDKTIAYSLQRIQFGRPIGSFQAYKHRLADMMVEIEQARSAVYWAACAADEHDADAKIAAHGAKALAADTFFMCAANMIQLHGGIGFTWEHDAHLYFRRAKAVQHLLGSSHWHREQVAQLIGLGDAA